jgi:hypothetical protein
MNSQRISHTHLQFAQCQQHKPKLQKSMSCLRYQHNVKIKYENTTKCKRNCGFCAKFKVSFFEQNSVIN